MNAKGHELPASHIATFLASDAALLADKNFEYADDARKTIETLVF